MPQAAIIGRPRSAAIDRAILAAAFELFIENGVEGASIERIARRAGVAKTSIYRRWPSRDALLAQAIEAVRSTIGPSAEMVDEAGPAAFVQLLLDAAAGLVQPQIQRLLARLIGSIPDHPQLFQVYRDTYYRPRRQALAGALQRAQSVGLLPRQSDVELSADMLLGALLYRLLLAGDAGTPRTYALALLHQLGFPNDALPDAGEHTAPK